MKIFFVIFIIVIILLVFILFDIFMGCVVYKKNVYEFVFLKKKSDIELIYCGVDFVEWMMEDICQVVFFVYVMFFIMKNDEVSYNMFMLLKVKVKVGVFVYLLLDWFGS